MHHPIARLPRTACLGMMSAAIAVGLSSLPAVPAAAMPDTSSTPVQVSDLVNGDSTLRMGRSYTITTCSAASTALSLYVQTANGRWLKVATAPRPTRSADCPYTGSPWLQSFAWTVNQVGEPTSVDAPNDLTLAIGQDSPRSRFHAGVWPGPVTN